jgi:hypothetical protein
MQCQTIVTADRRPNCCRANDTILRASGSARVRGILSVRQSGCHEVLFQRRPARRLPVWVACGMGR